MSGPVDGIVLRAGKIKILRHKQYKTPLSYGGYTNCFCLNPSGGKFIPLLKARIKTSNTKIIGQRLYPEVSKQYRHLHISQASQNVGASCEPTARQQRSRVNIRQNKVSQEHFR